MPLGCCNGTCQPIPCSTGGSGCPTGQTCCGSSCCTSGQLCCEQSGPVSAYDPIDAHGVELAAIKALYERLRRDDALIERLERDNHDLRNRTTCGP